MSHEGPRVGCGAALVRDGKVLLIQRLKAPEAGCWALVGGKVEWLETVEDTIIRETLEEVGVQINRLELLTVIDLMDAADQYHWVSPVYLVEDFTGEPQLMEPTKHGAVQWFDLDNLPSPVALAAKQAADRISRRASSSRGR